MVLLGHSLWQRRFGGDPGAVGRLIHMNGSGYTVVGVGEVRLALVVLFAAAAFVLSIACVNVANLLLARGSVRQREMSLRHPHGAWRAAPDDPPARGRPKPAARARWLGFGLIAAFALSGVLSSLLYEVRPTDALTFAMVSILLLGVALVAAFIPARRASRVDPVVALRAE